MAAIASFTRQQPLLRRTWAQFSQRAIGAAGEEPHATPETFAGFLRDSVWLDDNGGTKLEPWRWQIELAEALPGLKRVIVLKGRQLGVSWLLAAYALTVAAKPGAKVLLFSQTEPDAWKLLKKAKFILHRAPAGCLPDAEQQNLSALALSGAGSIEAFPSTEKAGRGVSAAKLAILDEHAFHQWADANMSAVDPAVEADGQMIAVSTANGMGNLFQALWASATGRIAPVIPEPDGVGGYTFANRIREAAASLPDGAWLPIFLPYFIRPGRDAAWLEAKRETYAANPAKLVQEYPADAEQAFIQTGRPVFDKQYLDRQRKVTREPLPAEAWPAPFRDGVRWPTGFAHFKPDELRVFETPAAGHTYVSGADVAEGLAHGDYDDLSVLDTEDGREVLSLHGHWPLDVYAHLLDAIYRLYPGTHAVERNNHGHAVLLVLKDLNPPGLYREVTVFDQRTQADYQPGRLGWVTGSHNKHIVIDELEQAIRLGGILLSDALALPEFSFYRTEDGGGTSAPPGMHDDRVMSRAIAWQMRKHRPRVLEVY